MRKTEGLLYLNDTLRKFGLHVWTVTLSLHTVWELALVITHKQPLKTCYFNESLVSISVWELFRFDNAS